MAAVAQPFSLFPNPIPKISAPDPRNRLKSLHKVQVVSIVEEIPMVPPKTKVKNDMAEYSPDTSNKKDVPSTSPSRPAAKSTPPPPPRKDNSPKMSTSSSSSSTIVIECSPDLTKSPIVPIRSMFPTFDPSVPLSQQKYYPQRPYPAQLSRIPQSHISRDSYRTSLTTPIDKAVGIKTAPASVLNFADDTSIYETRLSSHKELEKLWEASRGTEINSLIRSFDLEMARISEAIFTFGADPGFPFYTLQTYNTNEIAVHKTCPLKRTETTEVVLSSMEPATRRLPPADGLVTFIFPKLAASLAVKQSTDLVKQHNLAPTDKTDIEFAAVRRAAEQEGCNLRWNNQYRRYELEYPVVGVRSRESVYAKLPSTPELGGSDSKPVLHITVSSNTIGSGVANASNPPVILVTDPNVLQSPGNSATVGFRLSTIPQSDVDKPLALLDFGSLTLNIDADHILKLIPSQFAVDSIVSAILAVAVADESTNPIMAAMNIWTPRPKAPGSMFGGSVKSYTGNAFYATIAERGEVKNNPKAKRKEPEVLVEENTQPRTDKKQRTWYGMTKKEKTRTKKVMVSEFDLEKLCHYQAGSRKGQELPAVTRGMVTALVGGLRLIVWFLTTIVQFLVWLLVSMSRMVTSEKF